jgi:hypothetical protein
VTPYITDRSRIDTRESCERARYLNYDFEIDGELKGIQRRQVSLPLLNGVELHEAHALVLAFYAGCVDGLGIEDTVELMKARYRRTVEERGVFHEANPEALIQDQTNLLEAMLRAFVLCWVPLILEEFEILEIEKPLEWQMAPGLVAKLRFDVTARRKGDGQLCIIDYKSMPYVADAWAKRLERSRQTALYISAAETLYSEPVEMAYLGLVKGQWRKDTAKSSPWYGQKIQSSPYLYAYALEGKVGKVYQSAYTPKKGYKKVRTYEEMTIKEWVDFLYNHEHSMLHDLFTWNPPFAPTKEERDGVLELVVKEELEYVENVRHYHKSLKYASSPILLRKAEQFLNLTAAPKRENSCFQYGTEASRCAFYELCFSGAPLSEALYDGAYEVRVPHHETDLQSTDEAA